MAHDHHMLPIQSPYAVSKEYVKNVTAEELRESTHFNVNFRIEDNFLKFN